MSGLFNVPSQSLFMSEDVAIRASAAAAAATTPRNGAIVKTDVNEKL